MEQGAEWPDDIVLQQRKRVDTIIGIAATNLYDQLGFQPGPVEDAFESYTQDLDPMPFRMDMIAIPGGDFVAGAAAEDPNRVSNELVQVKVKVDKFWMARKELSWEEYELWQMRTYVDERKYLKLKPTPNDELADAVTYPTPPYTDMTFGMGKNGYPAICMTHLSARMYSMWLSAKTGRFYRLPTAAEWEYACRAGTTTAYSFGDDPKLLDKYAWHYGNSDWQYQKVGRKLPNPFGLHDMHGNVWEWVLDSYVENIEPGTETLNNPLNLPATQYGREVRGGGWDDKAPLLRSASRRKSIARWKDRDPQIPQSVWYLTDAHWVGIRLVRPSVIPPKGEITKYWPSQEELLAIPDR